MSKRLRLPPPPKEYSQEYEKVRNREIEVVVNEKISNTDTGLYTGVPFVSTTGSNTAFSVPTGLTPTLVPYDTLVKNTDIFAIHDPVAYTLSNVNVFDALVFVNLYKPATTGNVIFNVILEVFFNGVLQYGATNSVSTRDNTLVSISGIGTNIPANTLIDVRVYHDSTSAVVFDVTKSRFSLTRYSQIPRPT